MSDSLISVITPVYNSEKTVRQAIDSVIGQSYHNWEMILVDDLSSDSSVDIISEIAKNEPRIKLIQLKRNSGAAKARNAGIEMAKGRFIAFLDSDDYWLTKKLEKQVGFHLKKQVAITHTRYEWMNAQGEPMNKVISAPARLTYNQLLDYNYIGCLTGMYDVELVGKVLMPEIEKRQDYGLWLNILKKGHEACFLNETLAMYRTGQNSLSSNKYSAALFNFNLLYNHQKLGLFKALWHFARYARIALIKYR